MRERESRTDEVRRKIGKLPNDVFEELVAVESGEVREVAVHRPPVINGKGVADFVRHGNKEPNQPYFGSIRVLVFLEWVWARVIT